MSGELNIADRHRVRATLGWLELGNPAEALAELDGLSETGRVHPDVLEIEWAVCAEQKDWKRAEACAGNLCRICPDRSSGWIHHAYAARRVPEGGLAVARQILLRAYRKFPDEPIISYNLACYAAQFDRQEEAWDWLERAVTASDDVEALKAMALKDDDLRSLWDRIREVWV